MPFASRGTLLMLEARRFTGRLEKSSALIGWQWDSAGTHAVLLDNNARVFRILRVNRQTRKTTKQDASMTTQFQRTYYREWFPVQYLCHMLGANSPLGDRRFGYRDFSFGNEPEDPMLGGDTVWGRRTLYHRDEFREAVYDSRLRRIDVGQLGYEPCQMWRSWDFREFDHGVDARLWRLNELILDIDIKNEYGDVRTCHCSNEDPEQPRRCGTCNGLLHTAADDAARCQCPWRRFDGQLCKSCWMFGCTAILMLDQLLRTRWGFANLLFTFSGKKGIHCWILDAETRSWTAEQRVQFFESMNPWMPGSEKRVLKWENVAQDTYFGIEFERSVLPLFESFILDTEIFDFAHAHTRLAIVECFAPALQSAEYQAAFGAVLGAIVECVRTNANCRRVWTMLMDFNYRYSERRHADNVRRRLVYTYVFPRIDKNSKDMGHLVKVPFAAHVETLTLDVPMLPITQRFSPPDAPRIQEQDVPKIRDVLDRFQIEIDIIRNKLYSMLYCEAVFPEPMPYRRLMTLPDSKARFRQCKIFLATLATAETVFARERDYRRHCTHCQRCSAFVCEDRQNTLRMYIQESCFDDDTGEFDTELERVLKLAWIEHLSPFYKTLATSNLLTEIKQNFN